MGIELDLFCLNANYPRSDRLRSSAPSDSFASALPGWSFYLEDLRWEKWVWVANRRCLDLLLWGLEAISVSHSGTKSSEQRAGSTFSQPCVVSKSVGCLCVGCSFSRVFCKGERALRACLPSHSWYRMFWRLQLPRSHHHRKSCVFTKKNPQVWF